MSPLSTLGFRIVSLACLLGGAARGAATPLVARPVDAPCTFGQDFLSGACLNASGKVVTDSTTSAELIVPRSAKDVRRRVAIETAQARVAPVHPPTTPPSHPRPPHPR